MALTPEEAAKLIADVLNGDQGFNRTGGAVIDPENPLVIRILIDDREYLLNLIGRS